VFFRLTILCVLSALGIAQDNANIRIIPAAQWTFDEAPERIMFRTREAGFPLRMLAYADSLVWFDRQGNREKAVLREAGDTLICSPQKNFMALMLETEQFTARAPAGVLSVRLFSRSGEALYTHSETFSLTGSDPRISLADNGNLLLGDAKHGHVREYAAEQLVWQDSLENYFPEGIDVLNSSVYRQGGAGARLVSADLRQLDRSDSLFVWLRLGSDTTDLVQGGLPGKLKRLEIIPGSFYSLLEVTRDSSSILVLMDRLNQIASYPWSTWTMKHLNSKEVLLITHESFMVINLADGNIAAMVQPHDLYEVSDATYIPGPDIFLTLRGEPFFTREGQLAYRNFELDAQDKSGRLVYRGSFGAWSPELPTLETLDARRFAIHLHNAVLMYKISY